MPVSLCFSTPDDDDVRKLVEKSKSDYMCIILIISKIRHLKHFFFFFFSLLLSKILFHGTKSRKLKFRSVFGDGGNLKKIHVKKHKFFITKPL